MKLPIMLYCPIHKFNKENEVNDLSSTVDPYEDKAGPSTAKTNESQSN